MTPMADNLAQQDYTREARRMWLAGDSPEAIRARTGVFVLGSDGEPNGMVRDLERGDG